MLYLSPEKKKILHDARDAGAISMFRVRPCIVCQDDTWKDLRYCSKPCYTIGKELGMENDKSWDYVIAKFINHLVDVETHDGMYLKGRLTKVDTITVNIGQYEVHLPVSIELDEDREKLIDISRLKIIKQAQREGKGK